MSYASQARKVLESTTPLGVRKYLRIEQASVFSGLPLTKLDQLVASRKLKSAKVGRTRLIERASLEALLDAAAVRPVILNAVPKKRRAGSQR